MICFVLRLELSQTFVILEGQNILELSSNSKSSSFPVVLCLSDGALAFYEGLGFKRGCIILSIHGSTMVRGCQSCTRRPPEGDKPHLIFD